MLCVYIIIFIVIIITITVTIIIIIVITIIYIYIFIWTHIMYVYIYVIFYRYINIYTQVSFPRHASYDPSQILRAAAERARSCGSSVTSRGIELLGCFWAFMGLYLKKGFIGIFHGVYGRQRYNQPKRGLYGICIYICTCSVF